MFENRKGRFLNFIKKQGFYLVLIFCVLAAGTICYFAVNAPGETKQPEDQNVQKQEAPSLEDELKARQSATPAPSPSPSATPVPSATPSPSASADASQKAAQTVKLTMPLDGEVTKAFSGETLVFNATLNTWMTHNGIDISAAKNTKVVAALAGTVTKVENDPSKGKIVTIEHTGKQQTVYAGLEEASVKEGDKVNAGQEIGKAGTPGFEAAEGAHLHFEYLANGNYADPLKNMQTSK